MKKAIKALVISLYPEAGADAAEAHLIRELSRRGIQLEVITGEPSTISKAFEAEGIVVHYGKHPQSRRSRESIQYIRKVLTEGAFDILHLFNSKAIANGIQAAAGLPVKIITYRGSGDLHWHDPTAYMTHLHPCVDAISCLSNYVQKQVDKQFLWRRKKTEVHYKGFLPEWYEPIKALPRTDIGIPEEALIVGCAANYRKVKGIEYLLKATHHTGERQDLHLLLIGSGMDKPHIKHLIDTSPIKERIHAIGYRNDVLACLKTCDIYIQPSLKEGLGRSLIESMMLAKPVIATRAGAMPDLVKHMETGLLVPKKDPAALAEAIRKLASDANLRKNLGQNGKAFVQDFLSMEKYVSGVEKMYRRLAGE